MRFTLVLDPAREEAEVRVTAPKVDERIRAIEAIVSAPWPGVLFGYEGDEIKVLDIAKVSHFFTRDKKVYARDDCGQWYVRQRMYELEEMLPPGRFVRVSQSDIVAIRAIDRVDTSRAAGLILILKDGTRVGISRRFVRGFKKAIGL